MVEDGYNKIINEELAGKEALNAMYEQGVYDGLYDTYTELYDALYAGDIAEANIMYTLADKINKLRVKLRERTIMSTNETEDLIPDGIMYKDHKYCGFIKRGDIYSFSPVYIPKCNPNIVLRNIDEHWTFCPFCGGRLR